MSDYTMVNCVWPHFHKPPICGIRCNKVICAIGCNPGQTQAIVLRISPPLDYVFRLEQGSQTYLTERNRQLSSFVTV